MEEDYIDSLEQQLAKNRKTVEQRLNVVALQQELDKYKAKEKEIRERCKKRPLDEYYLIPIISVEKVLDILDSKE